MRPIDGDEMITKLVKWKRYGVDEQGKLVKWKRGSVAYVKLEDVLDTIGRMPAIDIDTDMSFTPAIDTDMSFTPVEDFERYFPYRKDE